MRSVVNRKRLASLVSLLSLTGLAEAQVIPQPGPPTIVGCAYNATPPTLTDGLGGWTQCDSTGSLRVTGTITSTPSGTQAVNQTQVNGVAVSTGNGVAGTGVQRVTIASDNTANSNPWLITPIPSATLGGLTSSQTGAAATNLAVSGAHNLFGLQITTAASAGRMLLFDATALPANGAVTPKKCWSLAANTTATISWDTPITNATGITVGFSTGADCYTLTAANAEFIAVDYK
jgi:hypothetical protein